VDEVDETLVPAHPVVEIEVTSEAVTVDGVVVDRGSAGLPDTTVAKHLGVHAAARLVAQPLGRPVRATLRCGAEEKRLVVHLDGSVSDVEDTIPVVSLVAAAGSRATPVSRHARRPIRTTLRVKRTKPAVRAAYVALGAVLAGGLLAQVMGGDDPAPAAIGTGQEPPAGAPIEDPVAPAVQAVMEGTRLERLPGIGQVVVRPDTGGFRLQVSTQRAARVIVRAALLSGDGAARLWSIRTGSATTRTLDIDDLPAGAYRWVVRSPGERPVTGEVVVPPTPEPPSVVTVVTPTPEDPSPTPDGGRPPRGDEDDGADSTLEGPTEPVDPDDPFAR
jgi:hypothetical protein